MSGHVKSPTRQRPPSTARETDNLTECNIISYKLDMCLKTEDSCIKIVSNGPDLLELFENVTGVRFLPARRYASAGLCDSDVSVCLSVRRAPVLCLAERKQDREMYTV